jgi:hypothetical protein
MTHQQGVRAAVEKVAGQGKWTLSCKAVLPLLWKQQTPTAAGSSQMRVRQLSSSSPRGGGQS